MRIPVLATLLGLSLVACAGQISGSGDDDDIPETCGNGAVDEGEECDGSEGCTATCTLSPTATPRLDVSVDKPTIESELGTTHMVTVTLTASDGFSGNVDLTASVVDAANAPLADWTATINTPTVSVPANGVVTAVVTLNIPTANKGLVGTLKVGSTSTAGAGTLEASSQVTLVNQVTFALTNNGGQCVYAYPDNQIMEVTEGTKIRFLNKGAITMVIHSDGGSYGINHQPDGSTITTDQAYERTVAEGSADGAQFTWYCHNPGPNLAGGLPPTDPNNKNPKIRVVAP